MELGITHHYYIIELDQFDGTRLTSRVLTNETTKDKTTNTDTTITYTTLMVICNFKY